MLERKFVPVSGMIEVILTDKTDGAYVLASDAQSTIADLQGQVEAAQAERDRYRAVLEGAEYDNVDKLATESVEFCRSLGALVAKMTKDLERTYQQRVAQLEGELSRKQMRVLDLLARYQRMDDSNTALQADHARVLGLVRALPLVNGVLGVRVAEVELGNMWAITVDGYFDGNSALFETENEANAYMALLKYRASLPAQRAKLAQGGANG